MLVYVLPSKSNFNSLLAPPDCHKTILRGQDSRGQVVEIPTYYLRFWVMNDGSQMANQAQVFLSGLSTHSPDGSFQRVESFLPMNLVWAHSRTVYADIAPSMGRHCDFGHVDNPNHGASPADVMFGKPKPFLSLDLEFLPNTNSHIVPSGVYRVELKVAANNANPTIKRFEFNIPDTWFNEEPKMFTEGIKIKEVNDLIS